MTSLNGVSRFSVGDRVTTRNHAPNGQLSPFKARRGVITNVRVIESKRTNKNGAKTTMCDVRWDGHSATTSYMRHRLVHLDQKS